MLMVATAGVAGYIWAKMMEGEEIKLRYAGMGLPPVKDPVPFVPKCSLPKLKDYAVSPFPDQYWEAWERRTFKQEDELRSWVDADLLWDLVVRSGYPDLEKAEKVCNNLREGAMLGCRGRGRLSTVHRNGEEVYTYGE